MAPKNYANWPHNMGGRFVESVKNARWLMSPHEAGVGLESMVKFQV